MRTQPQRHASLVLLSEALGKLETALAGRTFALQELSPQLDLVVRQLGARRRDLLSLRKALRVIAPLKLARIAVGPTARTRFPRVDRRAGCGTRHRPARPRVSLALETLRATAVLSTLLPVE